MLHECTEQDFRYAVANSTPSEHNAEVLVRHASQYWFSARLATKIVNDVWLNGDYRWIEDGDNSRGKPFKEVFPNGLPLPDMEV